MSQLNDLKYYYLIWIILFTTNSEVVIDPVARVFANGPGDQVQSQVESYQRL